MLLKPLLTITLAACGVSSTAQPNSPTEFMPPEGPKDDEPAYFCCDSVDGDGTGSGKKCQEIPHSYVGGCPDVLKCSKGYTKDKDGNVTCTEG